MDINTASSDELDGVDPKVYQRRMWILATMCLSLLMISTAISSVNVAIPTISRSELRPTATQVVWIVDAYALAFAALLLPAGAIGDRFGRKGTMLAGLVVFASASVACAYMSSTTALIAFRAVMGAGAALIMPSTLSLLQSSFPRRERAKAFAVWAAVAGAAGGVGPLLGGLLVEHFWYGAVFFASVPFAAIAFVAAAVLAPSARETVTHRFDLGGAALSITGLAALLVAIIEGPERGWGDPVVAGGIALAALLLIVFVRYERRRAEPMLDMVFFRDRRFATATVGVLLTFYVIFGMIFLLVQYLQNVKGYSPLEAGARGLPFPVTIAVVAPRAPRVTARIGAKRGVAGGMATLGVGVFLLSLMGVGTSYAWIVVTLVVAGLGTGITMAPLTSTIMQSVPAHKAGVGSAMNDTTREVGAAIGIAASGSIMNSIYRSHAAASIATLPAEWRTTARLNAARALAVVDSGQERLGAAAAADLRHQLRQSFVDGAHLALRVCAVVMVVAASITYRFLPDRSGHHD